jgi:hypothetical protein
MNDYIDGLRSLVDWLRSGGKCTGGSMDQETSSSVLGRWIGSWIELHHAASSAEITPHGEMISGPVESRVGTYRLEAIDERGIEASILNPDERRTIFVPWHSVLLIQGPSREELQREQDQPEQTEEATSSHRRQELMDLMANAGTPTQVAVARAAADTWLSDHPSDGDVRAARDRLADVYPAGD